MKFFSQGKRISKMALFLAAVLWSLGAYAQEWTRFRGPDGAGWASLPGLPEELDPEKVFWTRDLDGTGHSSPVVYGNQVYLTLVPDDDLEIREMVCIEADTGLVAWRKGMPFKAYAKHRFNSYAVSTPTVDEKGVYVCWSDEEHTEVLAWDHEGTMRWRQRMGGSRSQHGIGASIVIAGGVLIVPKEDRHDASFVAGLNPEDGEILWETPMPGNRTPYGTPSVRRAGDREELIFSSSSNGVYSLDPATGRRYWAFDHGFQQRCVASPVVMGNQIFVSAGEGSGGRESAVIRLTEQGEPELSYRIERSLPYVPTSLYRDGLLFIVNDGGIATCHDAESGEPLWRERVCGEIYASPIGVDDRLYLFSRSGQVVTLRASRHFEKLGEHDWEESIHATPAVAGGRLFNRTERRLVCMTPPP